MKQNDKNDKKYKHKKATRRPLFYEGEGFTYPSGACPAENQ